MSYPQPGTPGPQDPTPNPYGAAAPGMGAQAQDPAQGLSKVGMILAIIPCTAVIGLIISIVAKVQSSKAGFDNKNAKIGIIVGAAWIALSIIINIISGAMNAMS